MQRPSASTGMPLSASDAPVATLRSKQMQDVYGRQKQSTRKRHWRLWSLICALLPLACVFGFFFLTPSTLYRVDSQTLTTAELTTRVPRIDWNAIKQGIAGQDPICQKAYDRGVSLNRLLHSESSPDSSYNSFPQLHEYGWSIQISNDIDISYLNLNRALRALEVSTEKVKWTGLFQRHIGTELSAVSDEERTWPATFGKYDNEVSMEQGVIIAKSNQSPDFMNRVRTQGKVLPKERIVPLKHWSDVVFLAYKEACTRKGADPKNLEHIFRHHIANDETMQVLRAIAQMDSLGPRLVWPGLQFKGGATRAVAALGTSNGLGIAYLFGQHKSVLGDKVVDQVNIFECGDEPSLDPEWCMYFHLADDSKVSETGSGRRDIEEAAIAGGQAHSPNSEGNSSSAIAPRWCKCDWTALSRRQYSQDSVCEAMHKKGDLLSCMMRDSQNPDSSHADFNLLQGYGWQVTYLHDRDITDTVDGMQTALSTLEISLEPSRWGELNAYHRGNEHYPRTEGSYVSFANFEQGVLVALEAFSPDYYNGLKMPEDRVLNSRLPPAKQWSDVVFLGFQHYCPVQKRAQTVAKLQHVFKHAVLNEETREVMRSIVGAEQLDETHVWPGLQFTGDQAQALALLGTPNGAGMAWLFGQHKLTFRERKVDQVNVFQCSAWPTRTSYWCLYFHIVPA